MIKLRLFSVLTFVLFSGSVNAIDVWIDCMVMGKYDNYKVEIEPHEDFVFKLDLTNEAVVSRLWFFKTSPQLKIKHRFIGVGVNEYEDKTYVPDAFCASDAQCISGQNYFIYSGGAVLLTNTFATKDVIRQKIADAAGELTSGDSLLFYYAGRTENGSSLLAYDADYTVSEFAEDLGKFADGVKIVLILDAAGIDKFLNVLPAEIVSDPDLLLIACTRNSIKKCKGYLGPFMTAWFHSDLRYLSDFNKDAYLSFYEMAKRAEAYLKAKKIKEKFFFKNEELADKLHYNNADRTECYGDIEFDIENKTFTFTMPDIDGNATLTVEAPKKYYEDLIIYPNQGTFNVNLKKNTTKFTLDFEAGFSLVDDTGQTYSLRLNKVYIPIVGEVKMKKDGKSGTFYLQDRAFKNIGTIKFQCLGDKFSYRLKLTDKETLSEVLEKSSGTETIDLLVRHSWHMGPPQKLTYDKTYKEGKSLTAKLQAQE
jgi:hypothetical protein